VSQVAAPETAQELELYHFQAEAVEELRENIRRGIMNQVLCAPTGAGKTIMATWLIQRAYDLGHRAVFVADRIQLIDQTSAVLDDYGIPHGVIQGDHWRHRPYERIQVASAQTLARRGWSRNADLLVIDECHTLHSTVLERIKPRDTVTVGLTATPFARGMAKWYDALVTAATTEDLIERGFLAPFRVYAPSEPDMDGAKVSAGEWTTDEASKRAIPIVGDCVREYLRHAEGRKFVAFGADVAHCEELQRQFEAAGVPVGVYSYRTPDQERAEMLEEFRKPDSCLRGLSSVAALAKGFDVADIGCVILARPLRSSLTAHIQSLGRGLRRDPNDPEKECVVLDHAGNCVRFWPQMNEFFEAGPPGLDDGKKRKRKKRKPPDKKRGRKCPQCSHVHSYRPHCPECGHEYPRRKRIHKDGELVEAGSGATASMDEKQRVYSELIAIQRDRRYKKGWVAHKYRERFGVWPHHSLQWEPRLPSRETLQWVKSRMIAWAKSKKNGNGGHG